MVIADRTMSDDEAINEPAHRKLLAGINSLVRTQDVSKASRTEPNAVRSEFNLFKRTLDGERKDASLKVHVGDLLGLLKKTNKTTDVGKDLGKLKTGKGRLVKPLEKVVVDRIERDTLYGKTQKKLDLWEPVVTASDVAPQTVFPLQYGKLGVEDKAPQKLSQYRVKSDLMVAMEELDAKYRQGGESDEEDKEQDRYELTLEELREKRQEAARQRIRESYKIAKGRRMNKIKSKKFHKLMKRDKIREQIKQFEELQKTDPEAALKQLELIERQRFQERATLRHKNTGSWAKNMQIRAKYDMNVRQELAEQLSIGKELMGKRLVREDDESSESGEDEVVIEEETGNPWMGRRKPGEHEAEANKEFTSGYRKYWEKRNQTKEALEEMAKEADKDGKEEQDSESDDAEDSEDERELAVFKKKVQKSKAISTSGWVEEDQNDDDDQTVPLPKRKRKQVTVEDMFNDAEQLLQQRVSQKLAKIRKEVESKPAGKSENGHPQKKSKSSDLAFKKKASLADADVELDETAGEASAVKIPPVNRLDVAPVVSKEETINTKAFVQVKPKHLLNAIPDLTTAGELSDEEGDDPDLAKRLTIAEAFADDDIVADFERDKQSERERNQPQEVDTFLPGWGAWGGAGIKQKTRRKMFKKVPVLPRKDDNREKVIINEDAVVSKKLAGHLVNELPFPFVSVRDYEASLRAPLGRTFVPETAHATLVEPTVVTKMGAVIEPMKKDILLQAEPAKSFRVGGKQFNKAVRKYEEFLETKESI